MIDERNGDVMKKVRERIEGAHEDLIDTYLGQLREIYVALPPEKRQVLLRGLDDLLEYLEKPEIKFDPNRAIEIRKRAGMSQKQLAIELGVRHNEFISKYERRKETPSSEVGTFGQRYLAWLEEHGY